MICSTRADKHLKTILPSLHAGQDAIVEWPIAANIEDVNTLVEAAKKSGSRVMIGLQRRWHPAVVKVKQLISHGELGKVLSSDVKAYQGMFDPGYGSYIYFADRKIGGNPMTIIPAHSKLRHLRSVVQSTAPALIRGQPWTLSSRGLEQI